MRKSRFTEAQIVTALKELDAGRPAVEVARKHGIHVNTLRLCAASTAAWKPAISFGSKSSRPRTRKWSASSLVRRSRLTP